MPVMGGVLLCLFLVLVSPLFLLRGQHGMTAISRLGQMAKLPDGVVTFLFTDVEGSTRLWEEAPNLMKEALRLHDGVIGAAVEAHNGVSVKPRGEGDSQFMVFPVGARRCGGFSRGAASSWQRRIGRHRGHCEFECRCIRVWLICS